MRKDKMSQYQDQRMQESIELGRANDEILRNARSWCSHFRAEMVSAGMLAAMYRLPIGSHRISCQFASQAPESMNLPWIVPEFILSQCSGCDKHKPNGDTSWAERLFIEHKRREEARRDSERQQQHRLSERRKQVQQIVASVGADASPEQKQIVETVAELFSDSPVASDANVALLIQSAQVAPDMFSDATITLLIEQAQTPEFAPFCYPVCVSLARYRPDLKNQLDALALMGLRNHLNVNKAADILVTTQFTELSKLDDDQIAMLILGQNHCHRFGLRNDPHQYAAMNALLHKIAVSDVNRLVNILGRLISSPEAYDRTASCGTLKDLIYRDHRIGSALIDKLIAAINFPISGDYDDADHQLRSCLEQLLRLDYSNTETELWKSFDSSDDVIRNEILKIYRGFALSSTDRPGRSDRSGSTPPSNSVSHLARRMADITRSDTYDVSVRTGGAEILEIVCHYAPVSYISEFECLLGYYALLVDMPPPNARKRIILPGHAEPESAQLRSLEAANARMEWARYKDLIVTCLKRLCEAFPDQVFPTIAASWHRTNSKDHAGLRAGIVELLGAFKISAGHSCNPLPQIMNAMMDYESVLIRSTAIQSLFEVFRYAKAPPPKNVVDALILHLRDEYVAVHKAVFAGIEQFVEWLGHDQILEVFYFLLAWLRVYSKSPYETESIRRALWRIADRSPLLHKAVAKTVTGLFPTGEALIDEDIAVETTRHIDPSEPEADISIAVVLGVLTTYSRDRYNSYDFSDRRLLLKWIRTLPDNVFFKHEEAIADAGADLAGRDAWEALHMAGIFAERGRYKREHSILEAAINGLKGERRTDDLRKMLEILAAVAAANDHIEGKDMEAANDAMRSFMEATK